MIFWEVIPYHTSFLQDYNLSEHLPIKVLKCREKKNPSSYMAISQYTNFYFLEWIIMLSDILTLVAKLTWQGNIVSRKDNEEEN